MNGKEPWNVGRNPLLWTPTSGQQSEPAASARTAFRVRTWMIEATVVGAVLALVAAMTGGGTVQWLSAVAVLLSFMHAQVAERMTERQAAAAKPDVECWRWSRRYFLGKELAWCAVFSITRAWPALAGVALFLAYPAWRRFYAASRMALHVFRAETVQLHGAEAISPYGRCDTCGKPATSFARDAIEVAPILGYAAFEPGDLKRGCADHPAESVERRR